MTTVLRFCTPIRNANTSTYIHKCSAGYVEKKKYINIISTEAVFVSQENVALFGFVLYSSVVHMSAY